MWFVEGDMMKKRILAASPVQQKPAVLEHFLDSLANLEKDSFQLNFLFVDNNVITESSSLLTCFKDRMEGVTIIQDKAIVPYHRDEHTHYWNDTLVDKVAAMKDRIIDYAVEHAYEALFLIDSDLLLHPNTLSRLSEANKDVISNIFWTKWQQEADPLPQVWMMDEYSFTRVASRKGSQAEENAEREAFLKQMRIPGVYEVGGLGACTLISLSALKKGVRFQRLPNVSFWGEDRHFCVRAAALGVSLFVDTRYPAYHIYRDSDLDGVQAYKRLVLHVQPPSITISLCMIVKNEEGALEQCLSSVEAIADEIILVDTGSTDRTKEIAQRFTPNIYDFEWIDDFGAARNFAFSKATKEYIMWLDADDVLLEQDRQELLALKSQLDPRIDSVMMNYHLATDASGNPTASLKRNRLVKRSRNFQWIGAVHEFLDVSGHIIQSEIAVTHTKKKAYTDRNLKIYRRKIEQGKTLSPRDLYYFSNELKDHAYYEEAVVYYERFLAGKQGWVEDQIAACGKLADCYAHLYERDMQLRSLFRTMDYGLPRADTCCGLGALFLAEGRLQEAVYWYEAATRLGTPPQTGTFINHSFWTWVPYLQLCVCYDKLGDHLKAYESNEKALQFSPDHPSMLANKAYLEKRLGKEAAQ
jgi:glycosyltransferase involved in cell wall biosynthesis